MSARVEIATLGDEDHVVRDERTQSRRRRRVLFERLEVAMVHTDDVGTGFERALEVVLVEDLDERTHPPATSPRRRGWEARRASIRTISRIGVGATRSARATICTGSRTKSFQSDGNASPRARASSGRRRSRRRTRGSVRTEIAACAAALRSSRAMRGRVEVGVEVTLRRRAALDLGDERHPVCRQRTAEVADRRRARAASADATDRAHRQRRRACRDDALRGRTSTQRSRPTRGDRAQRRRRLARSHRVRGRRPR